MSLTSLFNQRARVDKNTPTTSNFGTEVKAWSTRISMLKCRYVGQSQMSPIDYGKQINRNSGRVYCEANTTNRGIVTGDRWVWNNRVFDITGIYEPGEMGVHLQIDVEESGV